MMSSICHKANGNRLWGCHVFLVAALQQDGTLLILRARGGVRRHQLGATVGAEKRARHGLRVGDIAIA
jgi:hypothetical protein